MESFFERPHSPSTEVVGRIEIMMGREPRPSQFPFNYEKTDETK